MRLRILSFPVVVCMALVMVGWAHAAGDPPAPDVLATKLYPPELIMGHQQELGIDDKQREDVLVALSSGKLSFDNGLPTRVFWTTLYQTVMEGMFSDPIYGGNRNKAGWRLIGFPGAIAVHRENVEKYRDKKFPADPISISDMS